MIVGPIVNAGAIVLGSVLGTLFAKHLPDRVKNNLPLTIGCACMAIGISLIVKVSLLPAVILALLIGTIIGEFLSIEDVINNLSSKLKNLINRPKNSTSESENVNAAHNDSVSKFVTLLVLFCVSGMGIFGALAEGINGDPTLLITKSFLDFCVAIIFASTLGLSIALIIIPQLTIQLSLYFLATTIQPLTTPEMLNDFSACGGIIMLAMAFRMCNVKHFPITNMLPSLFFVMPISYLWSYLF